MIDKIKKTMVIAPHPDDETLSCGGTMLKFKEMQIELSCLIVSGHLPPLYDESAFEITKQEALTAFKKYNIDNYNFLKIPATKVNELPKADINNLIYSNLVEFKPDMLFIPFPDRHIDHRVIFDTCMVASRPNNNYFPKTVLAYETLSETHWNAPFIEPNFIPNFFIDISKFIDEKLNILSLYKSQIAENNARSIDAVEALAKFRGSQNGCKYAEAFQLIRHVD